MAEFALKNGDNVVATLRNPADLDGLKSHHPDTQLLVLTLDVTKPQEIIDAFAKTREVFGRLDVVFNSAGYGLLSEVEGTPDDVARVLFETNFWGAANVSREAVKFFREVNPSGTGGRLLTVSSFVGLQPLTCCGYYSASKHALEGLTEAFASELDPEWNIKVTLIVPGTFKTKATTNAVFIPPHPSYTPSTSPAAAIRKALEHLDDPGNKLGDPLKAIQKIYELSSLPQPPLRLMLGQDAITYVRSHLQSVSADADGYESWSEDLKVD
ncbi:hypothetical protein EW026_g795 [Hermanssonia centrifuga]|uniref:NAD(P)-binding protein n=1 Tax=Hermanssonia centrifuga TaxID=98765 RepID=A0A4V3XBG9_9APHY|nr:hypothetical protein EW026_g795 [Hermanssonia centrifuga]